MQSGFGYLGLGTWEGANLDYMLILYEASKKPQVQALSGGQENMQPKKQNKKSKKPSKRKMKKTKKPDNQKMAT